jgi:hypothetical protein
VKALCFRKSRRSIGGVLLNGTYVEITADTDLLHRRMNALHPLACHDQ